VSLWAPVLVYTVTNPGPAPTRKNRPWHVLLFAQYGYLDLSILVCDLHNGTMLWGCVDASDNGPGMVNSVNVPGFKSGDALHCRDGESGRHPADVRTVYFACDKVLIGTVV
jgi:hypothetical protein